MVEIARWNPPTTPTKAEERVLKRLVRVRKLYAMLYRHRALILNEAFQDELAGMYRQTGAGQTPVPPAQLCMLLLLQGYAGVSDAEAIEMTVMDTRWKMVLDRMGQDEPLCGQGTLQAFRERLIAHDMDVRLLQRTVEVAKETKAFDWKKLPKDLRVGMDSRPLRGAGRVEDTFNLLGHAARKIAQSAANMLEIPFERFCQEANIPVLLAPSIKAGLDIHWADPEQKDQALDRLVTQIESLWAFLEKKVDLLAEPLTPYIEALATVCEQNLEQVEGQTTLIQGVAKDRRISIEDEEMRHGHKSKTKRFDGYKEHVAVDLDTQLNLAAHTRPANEAEHEAAPLLNADIEAQGLKIHTLQIDLGYLGSPLVDKVEAAGGRVLCKPWPAQGKKGFFSKRDFDINLRDRTLTCPSGQSIRFRLGKVAKFDAEICQGCTLRSQCISGESGAGRTVSIRADEARQKRLRTLQARPQGRQQLRGRTGVEHSLGRIAARKGPKARFKGTRKNTMDLRRAAAIQNLETIQRRMAA